MMALLEVENLKKSFSSRRQAPRPPAVDGVSFELNAGQTLAVVGESGAGKSTVGRMVLRFLEPDSGSVTLDGVDVLGLSQPELRAFRARMQTIFQDPQSSLDPRVPVGQSIAEPLKVLLGVNRSDREAQAVQLMERVALGRYQAHRLPHELSGGQLQRIAIARALAVKPSLIFCDEPVAALDVSVRSQVLNLMIDLQQEFGMAYLFVSHDLTIVESIADHVAVMQSGRLIEYGDRDQVFGAPTAAYTRELLDAVPIADPTRRTWLRPAGTTALAEGERRDEAGVV